MKPETRSLKPEMVMPAGGRFAGKNAANVRTHVPGTKPACNALQCARMPEIFSRHQMEGGVA